MRLKFMFRRARKVLRSEMDAHIHRGSVVQRSSHVVERGSVWWLVPDFHLSR